MHLPSSLCLPASARPWYRPERPVRGTRHLTSKELGVARRSELLDMGYTDTRLRRAVRERKLGRVAPGWYRNAVAASEVLHALASGCRITCVDACEMHGLWVPYRTQEERETSYVYRPTGSSAEPDGLLLHPSRSRSWPEPDAVASLPFALEHAMRCQDGETAAVLLESAMNRRLMTPLEIQQLLDRAPGAVRSRIGTVSVASDSGSETRVARWLRRRGFDVEQQVFIGGVGYADIYAAGLFLEIDGKEGHSGVEAFTSDRRRGLRSGRHGLQFLRLSYEQVWLSWEVTTQAVLDSIAEVGPFGRRKVERLLGAA